jgi:integrase
MEHVRAHRQPDTTRNYALRCRRFKREFGSVRLDKLKSHHLDAAYRRWLLEGLSPATINGYHGVLSSALGQAVKWGLISRSVAPLATLPTVARRRMTVPDVETVRLLVTKAEDSDPVLSAAIMLAALTGCRRGELLGLRWSDVERDQMVLQVQRSIKREEFGRVLRAGPTKTHQERKVALDPVMLAVIDTHRHRAEGWAADAGVTIAADGYMLTKDPSGETPMAPDTLTHRFSRLDGANWSWRDPIPRHSPFGGHDSSRRGLRPCCRGWEARPSRSHCHVAGVRPRLATTRSPSCDHSRSAVGSAWLSGPSPVPGPPTVWPTRLTTAGAHGAHSRQQSPSPAWSSSAARRPTA